MSGYSLLCSASGTGLSDVTAQLESSFGFRVFDVEETLKDAVDWSHSRYSGSTHTIGAVCSSNPRSEVIKLWREALDHEIQRACSQDPNADRQHCVLACHLTLFSGKRLESYVASSPAQFNADPPSQVVMLIDDIYDMWSRLSGAGALYDEEKAFGSHKGFAVKSAGIDRELTPDEEALLRLETRLVVTSRLLHWRKAEIIAAENLASVLGVPFRVVGVKHPVQTLAGVLSEPESPCIYVSHKITELRRENQRRPGQWDAYATEVNNISDDLNATGVAGIQPTAIDELRFGPFPSDSESLLDRPLGMTDRWPSNEGSAFVGDPEHLELFDLEFSSEEHRSAAVGMLRHFESTVFDEIAFRDHLLVSCNDGLLIYRPLALPDAQGKRRLSGGVRREIEHWALGYLDRQDTRRPIAVFIHTAEELLDHLPHRWKNLHPLIITELEHGGLGPEEAELLVESRNLPSEHLARVTGVENPRLRLDEAATTALAQFVLQYGGNVPAHARGQGFAIVVLDESDLRNAVRRAGDLFSDPPNDADLHNLEAVDLLVQASGLDSPLDLASRLMEGPQR